MHVITQMCESSATLNNSNDQMVDDIENGRMFSSGFNDFAVGMCLIVCIRTTLNK